MKVCVIGPDYPDAFATCINEALIDMGHESIIVDPSLALLIHNLAPQLRAFYFFKILALEKLMIKAFPRLEERAFKRILPAISKHKPELVINISNSLPPQIIEMARSYAKKVVFWFPDSLGNMGRQYFIASNYDAVFLKDEKSVEILKDMIGKKVVYLPECCLPKWHKKVDISNNEQERYGCDICIEGTLYWYRAQILECLSEHDIKIWGPPPPVWMKSPVKRFYTKKYIGGIEKSKAFKASKIILNTFHPAESNGPNVRMFEIAGCGGFQICEYRPSISKFFELDKEIVVFKTLTELKEKVRYYLDHPNERKEISQRAYEKAQKLHTYQIRLQELLKILKDQS